MLPKSFPGCLTEQGFSSVWILLNRILGRTSHYYDGRSQLAGDNRIRSFRATTTKSPKSAILLY